MWRVSFRKLFDSLILCTDFGMHHFAGELQQMANSRVRSLSLLMLEPNGCHICSTEDGKKNRKKRCGDGDNEENWIFTLSDGIEASFASKTSPRSMNASSKHIIRPYCERKSQIRVAFQWVVQILRRIQFQPPDIDREWLCCWWCSMVAFQPHLLEACGRIWLVIHETNTNHQLQVREKEAYRSISICWNGFCAT